MAKNVTLRNFQQKMYSANEQERLEANLLIMGHTHVTESVSEEERRRVIQLASNCNPALAL